MIEIIAECGVNHNGNLNIAKELVCAAKEAGANTVKFQLFDVNSLVSKRTPLAHYQKSDKSNVQTQNDLLKSLTLDVCEHLELMDYCKQQEIKYLTSVFDIKSLEAARNILNVDRVKLGSGELTNYQLIHWIVRCGLSVVLSTGMSNLDDIENVLNLISFTKERPDLLPNTENITSHRYNPQRLVDSVSVLHCTSQYPTPVQAINLKNIQAIRNLFPGKIGLSDHSNGSIAAITSVGLGVELIEKHFTLSRKFVGPDHKASMEPKHFKRMVRDIREAEISLGSSNKEILDVEKDVANVARKSLVALRDIAKGEIFTSQNLTVKRPGTGVSAKYYFDYLGTPSPRCYKIDELI